MIADARPIMILAGGTGGHVYPALAVAQRLMRKGHPVVWMGTRRQWVARQAHNYLVARTTAAQRGAISGLDDSAATQAACGSRYGRVRGRSRWVDGVRVE